jgi:hypothetical protein
MSEREDAPAWNFFLFFWLYGSEKPLFEKTWKLDDVEKVK